MMEGEERENLYRSGGRIIRNTPYLVDFKSILRNNDVYACHV